VALQESVKIIYYFNLRLLEPTEDYFGAFSDHVLVRFCFSCLALFFPVSSYGAMAQLSRDHGRDQTHGQTTLHGDVCSNSPHLRYACDAG